MLNTILIGKEGRYLLAHGANDIRKPFIAWI